jgi:ribonucleoside-triphosphate reductase (formate)
MSKIKYCIKRDGTVDSFDKKIITNAILESFRSADEGNRVIANKITESVLETLSRSFYQDKPHVENIQDVVEDTLITYNFKKSAKAYITYRFERSRQRDLSIS